MKFVIPVGSPNIALFKIRVGYIYLWDNMINKQMGMQIPILQILSMKKTEILLIAVATIAAISLYNLYDNMQPPRETMFKVWMDIHTKGYSGAQKQYRKTVWLSNYDYVQAHNARYEAGKQTYSLQMNSFADLTTEEFAATYLMNKPNSNPSVTKNCTGKQAPDTNLPESVDWSAKGAVTAIKNQGQCGSCWAFSATGALEGAKYKADSSLVSFSEQQLVDCSRSYGNMGCSGGLMDDAFYYVIDNGITSESKYPYKGVNGQCHYTEADKVWTIRDCTDITVDKEKPLMAAIAQQPVSVAIQANHLSFQLYKTGVYNGNCGTNLDHGVLAVGYGTLDNKSYYKVKNSWGSGWGAQGYIYIARTGDGKGKCGIQMAASFPIA